MSNEIWAYESQFKRGTRAYSPTKPSANDAVRYVLANVADELRSQRDEALQALRDLLDNYKHNDGQGLGIGPVTKAKALLAQYEDGDA